MIICLRKVEDSPWKVLTYRNVEDSPWGALNFEPFKFAGLRTKLRSLHNLPCFVEYIVTKFISALERRVLSGALAFTNTQQPSRPSLLYMLKGRAAYPA